MRIAVVVAVIVAVVGCAAGVAGTAADSADLRITIWPQGRDNGGAKLWTLRCSPVAGTLPRRAVACQRLAAMQNPFAPTPRRAICTDIYGGPQQAQIVGMFRGKRIWAAFAARNGCEISRAKRLAFLLPGFSTSGSA
jgi:subtilisin inhibitor-like